MYARVCRSVLSLVSVSLVVAGCDRGIDRSFSAPIAPGLSQAALVTAGPPDIVPEFLSFPSCRPQPAFRVRLSVTIHSGEDRFVHAVRFEFIDRLGGRAIPAAIPTFDTAATRSDSMPVPLPTSSPIPIPGTLPLEGLRFPSGSRTLPVVLEFRCGVPAAGTLVISVETTDGRGRPDVSRTSVEIGS